MSSLPSSSVSTALAPYGWDDAWADAFAPYEAEGLLAGRVVRVDRGQCDVVTAGGLLRADTAFVTPHDPLRVVCTGDWVAVEPGGNPRYVRAYLPRRTAFVRSTSSKRSEGQILAANVDHAVVAVSLAAELDLARIERFLALAWESGAQPVVVLTKADLVPDAVTRGHLVHDVETSAPRGGGGAPRGPGRRGRAPRPHEVYPCAPGGRGRTVRARDGEGLDVLAAITAGGTTVLLGQSGAGKSTLANALLGEDVMDVREIRDVDGKGRHTTTTRNLLALPGGGVLIDTPGLRGVGLWDAGTGVGQVFSEIEELAGNCRFHDCAHESEPGCAVLEAVETGGLPQRRLDSYRKLLRENQYIVAKTDARLRAEIRKDWKRKGAIGKAAMEAKRGRFR
ncbi:ribosome small subunit-dependent GTPase A [Streptomyces pilosus]